MEFRDFAPDQALDTPGIILDAFAAQPTIKGFAAMPSPTVFGSALPAAPQGATVAYYSTGMSSVIAGTATKLYRYVSGAPVETAGGQTFAPTTRWRFFQFGDDVIAVAGGVAPQVATGIGGVFAALAGTPPTGARTGTTNLGTAFLFKDAQWNVAAAGFDNNWVPNIQTLAATNTLYDYPGPILAAAPFYGTVIAFKQSAMWLGSFVGPPSSWSWNLISNDTGTWNQESLIILADGIAFLGNDDFYLTSGSVPTRIPNNLKEWFFANVNLTYIASTFGWYDPINSVLYWHFVSTKAPPGGVPDMYVSWNQRASRWSVGHLTTPCIPWPNTSPTIQQGLYFDLNNVLQQWSGVPGAMTLTSGFVGDNSRLSQLMRVRARYNVYPASQSVQAFHVNALGQPALPSSTTPALGADDWFNFRQYDRYHQVSLSTTGPCEVMGLAFEARPGGTR